MMERGGGVGGGTGTHEVTREYRGYSGQNSLLVDAEEERPKGLGNQERGRE